MRGTTPSPTLETTPFELIYILVNNVVNHLKYLFANYL
jgi:hypothetical protein